MFGFFTGWLWLIFPTNTRELSISYLFLIGLYLIINIAWDILTDKTPDFHISDLKNKVETLFNAGTFASSLLVILSIFDVKTAETVGATGIAYVLAGLSGLMVSLAGICPYSKSFSPDIAARKLVFNDPPHPPHH